MCRGCSQHPESCKVSALSELSSNRVSHTVSYVIESEPTRVSPSGKASASQADIRGFESRYPLHSEPEGPALFSVPGLFVFAGIFTFAFLRVAASGVRMSFGVPGIWAFPLRCGFPVPRLLDVGVLGIESGTFCSFLACVQRFLSFWALGMTENAARNLRGDKKRYTQPAKWRKTPRATSRYSASHAVQRRRGCFCTYNTRC